jgi:hypothetical protein
MRQVCVCERERETDRERVREEKERELRGGEIDLAPCTLNL